MITLSEETQIYIYTSPVDMRKSINGLVLLLADFHQQNPQSGDYFIFTNKQHNKIKILFWDCNGFVLYYKRLEKGRFCYSKDIQGDKVIINPNQLRALLMGLDFYLLGQYKPESCKDFF